MLAVVDGVDHDADIAVMTRGKGHRRQRAGRPGEQPDAMKPLTDSELEEHRYFLMHEVDNDEGMVLDMLDGYLHALAIGPETISPQKWLPKVWGLEGDMMPPMKNPDPLNHVLDLVMRHSNSIIASFEQNPPWVMPYWNTRTFENGTFEDAESWVYGFAEGVTLNSAAW